jgi:hypothetical protein
MKKRLFLFIIFAISGVAFLSFSALTEADDSWKKKPQQEVKDDIKIENKGYKKDRYNGVKLSHKKHQDEYTNKDKKKIACSECHHVYEDSKNVWKDDNYVQKCVECHNPLKSDPKNKKNKKLQLAFHNNCKKCHKDVVKAGLKKEKEAPSKKCIKCMGKKK